MKYIKEEDVDKLFFAIGSIGSHNIYRGPKGADYVKQGKILRPIFSQYLESDKPATYKHSDDLYVIQSKSDIIKNIIKDL